MAEAEMVIEGRTRALGGTFDAFRFRDFRFLWAGMLLVSANRPLQLFVQSWFVQTHADEDVRILLLGVLGALQGTATLSFSLIGGALADRLDRRRLLMATQLSALAVSGLVAFVIMAKPVDGAALFAVLYALFFLAAAVLSFDQPARQALIPLLVDRQRLTNAIALNTSAFQVALPVSVLVAGTLVESVGLGETYLLSVGAYAVSFLTLVFIRHRSPPAETGGASALRNIREGLAYARSHRTVLWVLVLLFVAYGVGMPAIIPPVAAAWMNDVLGLDAAGWGRIAVFWGLLALVASLLLASLGDYRRKGRVFLVAAAAFGGAVVFFGLARPLPLVALANGLSGGSQVVTQVTAIALIQSIVPNQYLGRVMSLVTMSFGLTQLNSLGIGALGQSIGLELTVPLAGAVVATAAVAVAVAAPSLRRAG